MKHWIPYTPIDREEIPPAVLNGLKYAYKIITFSKFGQKALQKHGFSSTLIPEGVDTNIFKPLDKKKVRDEMKFPQDKFIFGMIGANKPDGVSRKGWQQALDAFAIFAKTHPDAMFFYQFNQGGGFDVPDYARHLGIVDRLITPNMYMSVIHGDPAIVNKWLNCCDVILHASTTEGFGLVIAESQAAGTPVIVNDCHSQPELVIEGKTGEICKSNFKMWTGGGGYIYFPDPISIAEKMESLYKKVKENENKISTSCRAWIMDNYSIDKIFKDKWIPFLEELQTEILGEPQVDKITPKV
jgi:glycosyltransferase involved in cell wall biosynthesis